MVKPNWKKKLQTKANRIKWLKYEKALAMMK